jgi:hypothetical protein
MKSQTLSRTSCNRRRPSRVTASLLLWGMLAINAGWHVMLITVAAYTEKFIEFYPWYFDCAVIDPPLVTVLVELLAAYSRQISLARGLSVCGISAFLSAFHWFLIREASKMV